MNELKDPELATVPSTDDYAVAVLLVDDQAMVGEGVRRMLAPQPNFTFRYFDTWPVGP